MFLQFMAQHSAPFGLSVLIKCLILLRKRNEKWQSNCFHVVVKYRKGGSLKLYDTGILNTKILLKYSLHCFFHFTVQVTLPKAIILHNCTYEIMQKEGTSINVQERELRGMRFLLPDLFLICYTIMDNACYKGGQTPSLIPALT